MTSTYNFDTNGEWDALTLEGPAVHVPDNIKKIAVDQLRVEWLSVSTPEKNFYSKNHMIALLIFEEVVSISGKPYRSARLSMEVDGAASSDVQVSGIDNQILKCGDHYSPGIYTLKLCQYDLKSFSAAHSLTYNLKEETTIGDLIKTIIDKKMHHFLFLLYTDEDRYKGCGDHLIHSWAVFVREGWITSPNAIEEKRGSLSSEMTVTYLLDGRSTLASVGRGWWVSINPVQDEHTPEEMFSNAPPRHMLALAAAREAGADEATTGSN